MYLTIHFVVKMCHVVKTLLTLKNQLFTPMITIEAEKFIMMNAHKNINAE